MVEDKDIIMELDIRSSAGSYGMPRHIRILVIGCGGNGGHVVPQIMRYNRALLERLREQPRPGHRRNTGGGTEIELVLIDADTVEPKNLIRQNFIAPDIGRNKATVLAERYGRAFGLEVGSIEEYVNYEKAYDLIMRCQAQAVVVLGCVDNNFTRKAIHTAILENTGSRYMNPQHVFWIDVANEQFDGQLCIGYRSQSMVNLGYGSHRERLTNPGYWTGIASIARDNCNGLSTARRGCSFPMPFITEIYPTMLDNAEDFDPNDPSCADNAADVEQAISTNILSASLMFSAYCQVMACVTDRMLEEEEVERRPRANLIHFGHGGRFATTFNTPSNLAKVFLGEEAEF